MKSARGNTVAPKLVALATSLIAMAASVSAQSVRTLSVTRDLKLDGATLDFSAGMQLDIARDGSIAVTQPQDNKVIFFSPAGALISSVGRSGEGPGEFRGVGAHGRLGDSLWVLDSQLLRIVLISPEHKFARTFMPPRTLRLTPTDSIGVPSLGGLIPRAFTAAGNILTTLITPPAFVHPGWYPAAEIRSPIVLATPSGLFLKLIGWSPSSNPVECTAKYTTSSYEAGVRVPFCATPFTSFSRDGTRVGILTQENVVSNTGQYHLVVLSANGDSMVSRKYTYGPVAVPKRVADSAIASLLAVRPQGRGPAPEFLAAVRSLKLPVNYPPVRRLSLGLDGTIWVEIQTAGADHHFQILSATGDAIGQLVLPASVTLLAGSRGVIWGVERDQDDVESVVRYKVGQ